MKLYDDRLIVVTGGSGFIASGVVRFLNDKGFTNIVIVDELGHSEKWKNLIGKQILDVISKHQLFTWLEGREDQIEAFVHLGACTSTVETNASYLLENNYRYSVQLVQHALKHNHRFIYASSAATYGDGAQGYSDDHQKLDSLHPLNMYGFSKHLFDIWLKNHGFLERVVGLKFFNVFGPNEWHKGRMASTLFHMMPTVQKEGVVKLFKSNDPKYGDGEQKRDFIYVKDCVRIICAFLNNDATGIFNVGSGKASTWNEVAHALFKTLKKPVNIEYIPMPADLIGKYQNYSCADMKKTKAALGASVVNCMPLESAVEDYVQNHLIPHRTW